MGKNIMKQVDTMIKDSLATFANQLRLSHITSTLESIKYATEEVHWQIISHDFLTGAPYMMNPSCWAISNPNEPSMSSKPKVRYDECISYQNGDLFGKALKYELEYNALLLSSIAEMLRFKSHALDCRVVALMNTLKQMRNLLKFHHSGAWERKRRASLTVTGGTAVNKYIGGKLMCVVKAVRDTKLGRDENKGWNCPPTNQYPSHGKRGYCATVQTRLDKCKTQYQDRVSAQLDLITRQINATDNAIANLTKKKYPGCGM